MERTGFNWLRQARSELNGSDVTVLILDTLPVQGEIDVALEYVDFWLDWQGDQSEPAEPPSDLPPPIIPAAEIHKYHGVMVASLVRHLAPASTVVAARVLDDEGKGWSTTLIQAILWALSHRKNKTMLNGRRLIHDKLILNMSMGLPRTQAEAAEAICLLRTLDTAARAATLAVSATGNDSWRKPENPVEPAAYGFFADTRATATQIIAAAGTNRLTEYAPFSNEGHIAAPSRHIIGDTGPDSLIKQKYGFSTVRWSGTSFATPQISGLAALLWSTGRVPFYQIKQHIWRTAHLPRHWNGVREIDCMRAFRAN
jgi:subtilisin family serine protease